jgi:hypothetical protein
MDRQTDRQADGQIDRWTNGCTDRQFRGFSGIDLYFKTFKWQYQILQYSELVCSLPHCIELVGLAKLEAGPYNRDQ